MAFWDKAKTYLGYNAIEDKGRRQAAQISVKSEEVILTTPKSRKLQATAQEEYRNHALLAWMVRKHINYVTAFDPHVRTGYPDIDARVMTLIKNASRKENFDIAGRHDRAAAMRIFEAVKVLAGDSLFLKLDTGHVQGIEPDRITNPGDVPAKWKDKVDSRGLVKDNAGRVLYYCVCDRGENGSGYVFNQMVPAKDVIYDGYFFRFDQTRGVSPLSSALNSCQDLAEAWEWTLLKIKVHALFGIAVKRAAPDGTNYNKAGNSAVGTTNPTSNTSTVPNEIKPNGIMSLDLNPEDSVETIESATPNAEMIEYSKLMTRVTLLSLDIPYTTFDFMAASFSAMIADRILYEESAKDKREKNRGSLLQWSDWKIDGFCDNDDQLGDLLIKHRLQPSYIKDSFDWIPSGTPWLDKTKEVDGDTRALAIGADSTPRICKRRGLDAYKLVDEQADFLAYAKTKGVPIYTGAPGQETANAIDKTPDTPNQEKA